ncbi:ferritin-like fold-containing protein [Cryobacterium sp. BB736]|uniref:ferritin-like fold-containing protein n=1 Tax=Cryobacterium sp. BB736 TaxID=2746963 RepID=UPI001875E507
MAKRFPWLGRRKPTSRLRPRRHSDLPVNRVDISELTPPLERYLAHAAYIQLSVFQTLGKAVASAPTTKAKEAVSRATSLILQRQQAIVVELERLGVDAGEAMEPYATSVDHFHNRTLGSDWYEMLMTAYVSAGILDDCFVRLAEGLHGDYPQRMRTILGGQEDQELLATELSAAIDTDPKLASRLALWGRRLVGDTLLIARSALALPENTPATDERLEPVFTELIADHTRRMDDLGLTA